MTIKFTWGTDKINVHFFSKNGWSDEGMPTPKFDKTFTGVEFAEIPAGRTWKITITPITGYVITNVKGWNLNIGMPWESMTAINEDGSEAVITISDFTLDDDESITINLDLNDTDFEVKPFNFLYAVNSDVLSELNKERFSQTVEEMILDSFSKYIISVIELPFMLPTEIIEETSNIVVGGYRSQVSANRINKDEVMVSLGEIAVPSIHNNSLDYLNTRIYIQLPYMERVELELHYCIGEKISIDYIISLYDGLVTCNLSSTKINGVFFSKQFKLGRTIPFVIKEGGVQGDLTSQNEGLNNGIVTPIIEVVRNNVFETESPYIQDVIDYVVLGNCEGFVKVERVDLICSATYSERNSIISILESGVIIK